jgi:two-component system, OmpR family, phosphate regulon response regulator OmpR
MTGAEAFAASRKERPVHLPDDAPHLLLVDDDKRIRTLMSRYLQERGYRITTAAHTGEARALMGLFVFDLIVLDVMMPGESGLDFALALRRDTQVPILMLTARSDLEDRLRGLEAGADDYLSKPFDPKELALRIASILRRAAPVVVEAPSVMFVRFGEFHFDVERGELRRGDELIKLTERERAMLRLLARSPGEAVSREALAGLSAAGASVAGNERTIDVQINRLRRKIEQDSANPAYLQTARGAGYRLVVERS